MFTPTPFILFKRHISLAAIAIGVGTGGVQAQTSPADHQAPALCAALHTSTNLVALKASVTVCQQDPYFLARLGRLLNREFQFEEAASHLERALLLLPDQPDVYLSYAIALSGLGEHGAALGLVDQLLQNPAMPPDLRETIANQRTNIAHAQSASQKQTPAATTMTALPQTWHKRISLGARVGYDSNLFGAPDLDNLSLTFDEQTLNLPLSDTYLARGGVFNSVDGLLELRRAYSGGALWSATASVRARRSPAVPTAGSSQLDLSFERSQAAGLLGNYIGAYTTQLQPQAGSRYSVSGIDGGWAADWTSPAGTTTCYARLGLEAQNRRYTDPQVLSGSYTGWAGAMQCVAPAGVRWAAAVRSGHDTPSDATRPGGTQRLGSLRTTVHLPITQVADNTGLMLQYEHATQDDANKYSDLIESGRLRSVRRQLLRIELTRPAPAAGQWVLGADWLAQTSSLNLFRQKAWTASLGYRISW